MRLIYVIDKYKEIIMYLVFGILTTVINIISYFLFSNVLGFNKMLSNVIAWILSVLFAYITNKLFVFKSKEYGFNKLKKEITSFFSVRVFSLLVDMFIMWLGINILNINDMVIKIISNVIVVLINYIFSKILVFKSN
ncbi:MAG: GtrA family protein [Clostridium sp.]|nr:GtrA family protein [Clostridium sp.]MCI7442920.1 GtrA family protein [Clostridium sp.]